MIGLGRRELELLEQLVELDRANPGYSFMVVYSIGGAFMFHMIEGKRAQVESPDVAALLSVANAGLLTVQTWHQQGPGTFFLPSGVEQAVDELRAELGQPSEVGAAQTRISELEAQAASTRSRHEAAADLAGRWTFRAAIAVMAIAVAGLAAWAFLFSSIVPGVLAVALIVYAVLTDAWGWTGRALAQRLGQAIRRRVLAYLEPRP